MARALELRIPDYLGGENGLSPQMVQSGYGFYCEPHFDFDVAKYCLSIWNSIDGSDPLGWYFVLPSVEGKYMECSPLLNFMSGHHRQQKSR